MQGEQSEQQAASSAVQRMNGFREFSCGIFFSYEGAGREQPFVLPSISFRFASWLGWAGLGRAE